MTAPSVYVPLTDVLEGVPLPRAVLDVISPISDSVAFVDGFVTGDTQSGAFSLVVEVVEDVFIGVPFLKELGFVIGAGRIEIRGNHQSTQFDAYLSFNTIRLRFPRAWLQPVVAGPNGKLIADADENHFVEMPLSFGLHVNQDIELEPLWPDAGNILSALSKVMIPGTGIIIDASNILFRFSNSTALPAAAAALGDDFRGIFLGSVAVFFQEGFEGFPELRAENFAIGTGGIHGRISAEWSVGLQPNGRDFDPAECGMLINLFGDSNFPTALRKLSLQLEGSVPTEFGVEGATRLPFFDSVSDIELTLGEHGNLLLGLRSTSADGLVKLSKEDLFDIRIDTFGLMRSAEESAITVSGDFQLTHSAVKDTFPKVGMTGLTIYRRSSATSADWGLRIDGGTIQINKSIDLFGIARADVRELGLGRRGNDNVLALSAGVQLLEGVDAAVSVDNLRIELSSPPKLALDGLGIRIVVPDSFEFDGRVAHKHDGNLDYFEGDIDLTIVPVELGIGASFRVGSSSHCRFAFLAARVQFPSPGIQLAALPLYLTQVNGLIGVNTTPDANGIYDYYPLAQRPPFGLQHMEKWRVGQKDCEHHAIGIGATVSTANPRLLTMSALLAFTYPDLKLLVQGGAFVLMDPRGDPPFTSLLALDMKAPAALLNIGAKYEFVKGVINVDGTVESYHGPKPSNPKKTTSYFALGQVKPYFPNDRPVKATVLKIFKARSYFIVQPGIWTMGASIGLPKKTIDFSVASVKFEAEMKGSGELFWAPEQFKGRLSLKGTVAFRLFGKGFDLGLSSRVLGMAPDFLVDALLKFRVRFKVLVKTIKFGGTVPFKWERRRRPRVLPILKGMHLKHAVTSETINILRIGDGALPKLNDIPDVEPDFIPVLTFVFPTNDRTGFAFGQPAGTTLRHHSGDYTFEATLPEGGIALQRMRISQDTDAWGDETIEQFEKSAPVGSNAPVLFGAWQADQAPDGTEGATSLHLFARTPFEYSRATRLRESRYLEAFDATQMSGPPDAIVAASPAESSSAVLAVARAPLSENSAAVSVPFTIDHLKPLEEFRIGATPPLRSVQIAANEDRQYPWARTPQVGMQCRNFLHTPPGYRPYEEAIPLGNVSADPANAASDVVVGAVGFFVEQGATAYRAIAEVVHDSSGPYLLSFLRLHTNGGFDDKVGKVVSGTLGPGAGMFKVSVSRPVRSLTVHYDGIWSYALATGKVERPALEFAGAYYRGSDAAFWTGRAVRPGPAIDSGRKGVLTFANGESDAAFTDILFLVRAPARVFSICYELAPGADAKNDPMHPLHAFIDITWPTAVTADPNAGEAEGGPIALDAIDMSTPEGAVQPGYVYRLDVRTMHQRLGSNPRQDNHTAYFKVTRPPSDLSPYVLATLPRVDGFPHYRAHELYVRFSRNYVHSLCGATADDHSRISWALLEQGRSQPIATLPFRDDADADRTMFLQDVRAERYGWGWGKAPNHDLSREEEVWLNVYNEQAPVNISKEQAIPDDMICVYPVNPVLLRTNFWSLPAGSGAGPHFEAPVTVGGEAADGRWQLKEGLLRHATQVELLGGPALPDSWIRNAQLDLGAGETLAAPHRITVWVKADAMSAGRFGVVLAASSSTPILTIEIDLAAATVRLTRRFEVPATETLASQARPFSTPREHWIKLTASLTTDGNVLIASLEALGAVLVNEKTDIPAARADLHVGLSASADFRGWFDSFQLTSIARLERLPASGARHFLTCRYAGPDADEMEMFRLEFAASRYLDLYDQLDNWDRVVQRTSQASGTAATTPEVDAWCQSLARLLQSLNDVATVDARRTRNNASLEDAAAAQLRLRVARFELDEAFLTVADRFGLEVPAVTSGSRMTVTLSPDSRALMIQTPEPIDWTRLSAAPIRTTNSTSESSSSTKLVHNSDFTMAMLLRFSGQTVGSATSYLAYEGGATYLCEILEYQTLPPHLSWLRGWVNHRAARHALAFDIPPAG